MYYSKGNYESLARPEKPKDVDGKSAYLIGSGLASLAAAAFLVRDGQMEGKRIHILEKDSLAGGACDGYKYEDVGYVIRGGREVDNRYECLWDLFHSIPSLETEGASVLDEFYWLNKHDPNSSHMRATVNRGEDARTDGKFALSDKGMQEIMRLFFTPDEALYNRRISEVFSNEVLNSNFWLYWRTMFAFENWHSALEMKLYIKRFIHHIGGMPDFTAVRFTKLNQYESMILPLVKYLETHDVQFHYGTKVENIIFDTQNDKKVATCIEVIRNNTKEHIDLTANDLVFITNGGCVENSSIGSQNAPASFSYEIKPGGGWDMWRKIAAQDPSFGHPDKFCYDAEQSNWMSATVTTLDNRIPPYIQKICKRDPFSGKVVTGGIVTVKDSNWLLSWTFNRQPHFRNQPKDQLVGWIYGLFTDKPGNFVKKPMRECTGKEICMEWLYHIGVPVNEIEDMAERSANTVPCMMPYITAFFMPREAGDRPDVIPAGSVNFAFLGQFAETKRDTIFTIEYSVRTAMESVYTLLDIDRGVPEVWGSTYDVRDLLNATSKLSDGKRITDLELDPNAKAVLKETLKKIAGTDIEKLLKEYQLI
ncbi:oleate hydratase [Lacrimispora saccharolytica]|uniref:67 kDa myosin-cross-reactive antigen family protein n=1 Tax=Lacrimispora saccharolytica (strain ATCC 35040 / DSM 2544 / NRCC 2533 / WM1) TaxID=610130 RepID=D9R5Q1_LACSW|nr:oleate hydratase [Lacrimispora saccharolytica]ADL05234.1 67 kDa myosin-cross-reactive antigen family protein [[Clostridium] saccharolyticum WM1]QRV20590.1 oleate hydratase [Lacrimispora saccharolytica]